MTRSPRSRRTRRLAALLALPLLLASACDQVSQAVDDVKDTVEDTTELVQFCAAAINVARAVQDQDVAAAVDAGETMVEHAPDEIAAEARTVLDGARKARDGDTSAVQSESFQSAAQAVKDYTTDRCDPR